MLYCYVTLGEVSYELLPIRTRFSKTNKYKRNTKCTKCGGKTLEISWLMSSPWTNHIYCTAILGG